MDLKRLSTQSAQRVFLAAMMIFPLLLQACASPAEEGAGKIPVTLAREYPVTRIPLEGDVTRRSAEISGLAWYGQDLVLLPQYPRRFSFSDDGALLVLSREDIVAYLDGKSDKPLAPRKVSFVAPGLEKRIKGFEGYEAIAFKGSKVFMTIESSSGRETMGHLVTGQVAPDGKAIVMDPGSLTGIPSKTDLGNLADEALVVNGDRVLSFYEANGLNVNAEPTAHVFDLKGRFQRSVPFPHLEYRLTDATAADEMGRFWVLNFFFWGERGKLRPRTPDPLRNLFGAGPTHTRFQTVERLVEYRDYGTRIERTEHPPIQIELIDDLHPRNWEGVVRFDPYGFLLATDAFPETILAFLPLAR